MEYVVDFEVLKGKDGEFVVKELCLLCLSGGPAKTWNFRPPYSRSLLPEEITRENEWLTHGLHKIHWNDGSVRYNVMATVLLNNMADPSTIYTKGLEKAQFLADLLDRPVIDLQSMDCPKIFDLPDSHVGDCRFVRHRGLRIKNCAYFKAQVLARWLREEWETYVHTDLLAPAPLPTPEVDDDEVPMEID